MTVSGVRGEDGPAGMNETRSEKWRRLSRSSDWLALEMEANREVAAALVAARRGYPGEINRPNVDNAASPGEYEAGIRRWGCHEPEKAGYRNLTPEECGRLDDAAAAVLHGNTRELADVVADIKASMTLPELQVADRMPSDHEPQAESMAEAEFWRVIWRRFDYEETATWAVDAWGEALQAALAAGSTPITDEPSALPTPSPS